VERVDDDAINLRVFKKPDQEAKKKILKKRY